MTNDREKATLIFTPRSGNHLLLTYHQTEQGKTTTKRLNGYVSRFFEL